MQFTDVAAIDEIPVGKAKAFQVSNKIVGVFNCDGEFLAINDICPHAGASLSGGYVEGEVVACPWHAWRFNVRDGTWCDNPRLKTEVYEVKIENGRILIGIPEDVDLQSSDPPQTQSQSSNQQSSKLDNGKQEDGRDKSAPPHNQDPANETAANTDQQDTDSEANAE